MVRQERLEHMTRMAMYEKKEGQSLKIAQEYRKNDYVGLKTFAAFIIGTLIFFVLYGLSVFGMLLSYNGNLQFKLIATIIFVGLVIYVIYMFLLIFLIRRRALRLYKKGRNAQKKWNLMLEELERLYKQEEQKDMA